MRTPVRGCAWLLALLVLGAATNVLIALACARWGDHQPSLLDPWLDLALDTDERPIAPVAVESVPAEASEYLSDPSYLSLFGRDRRTGLQVSTCASLVCTRVDFERWHDSPYLAYSRTHTQVRFGLPCRSMYYAERSLQDIAAYPGFASWRLPDRRGGWPAAPPNTRPAWLLGGAPPTPIYPVAVIPLGFAANSLFFGTLWLSLLLVSRSVRRRCRRRRGVCVRCAYPVGVSPLCTECGTPIRRWRASPTHPPIAAAPPPPTSP